MKKTLLCFLFLFTTTFYAQLSYVNICSSESFNLTSMNSVFTGSLDPATPVIYFLSLDDALNNTNEITNPTNFYGPVGTTKIYGKLNNNGTYAINYFNLTVFQPLTVTTSFIPISCKGGVTSLSLNVVPAGTYYSSLNGGAFTTNKTYNNLPAGVYNIKVQSPNPVCPDTVINYTITEPNALTAVSTTSGQTVTVAAAGGTAPYQYSKDGTTYQSSRIFNGLASGNYNFRVKDSRGCAYVMPAITIVVPGSLAATAVITKQLDCISGATIVANATGGQAPYTYSVNGGSTYQTSNTFANILTGTFTIRVKDAVNTISISNPVIVTAPTAVNVTTAVTLPDCNNRTATITVIATGGQAPYSYSKDNGGTYNASNVFPNVLPGSYRIIVKDSKGCLSPFLNTAIEPYSPLIVTASSTSILCNGGLASLTISASWGRFPYQYSINNGASYTSSNTYSGLSAGTYTIKVKDALGCISTIENVINQPTALIATLSTSGANITVTTSGGTAPYQYSLDGGPSQTNNVFTVLTSGNYTVQVRDLNGCVRTFVTSIVVPAPLTCSAIITKDTDCISGATVAVNASGGQAPYLYSINGGISYQTVNTFTNIPSGTYTIKVKDLANTISNSYTITVSTPSPVTATTVATPLDCTNKATIRVQAIGGQAPYVYSLDGGTYTSANTFTGLNAGTYRISVRDSKNCISSTISVTIQPLIPLGVTASNTPILCIGGSASLTINVNGGQAPYQYAINNGVYTSSNTFNGLNAGPHSIKGKDALGCSSELYYVITEPTALTAILNVEGQTLNIIGLGGTAPYQYSVDGGSFQPGNFYTNLSPGKHDIFLKDGNGCESNAFSTTIEEPYWPLSVTASISKQIDCISNASIHINGLGGQNPYTYSIDGGATYGVDNILDNLTAGTYNIAVRDAANSIANTTIVINPLVPISATALVTPTDCTDSTITVKATGGQAPYFYSFDGGATYGSDNVFTNANAFLQTYHIVVKDSNGCDSPMLTTIVPSPSPLLITALDTSVSCNGGTASLVINPIGGQGPYQYSVNNSAYSFSNIYSSLIAGTYIIKVKDALGCSSETQYVITEPTALTANSTVEGQTVTINAQGGTAPYQYSINHTDFLFDNVFTNLSPGLHDLYIKDANGCEIELSANVVAPLSFTTSTIKQADCSGNTQIIVAAAGGQAPYSYSLSYTMTGTFYQSGNIFSKVPPGTYYLTVKDALNTVSSTNQIIISQPVAVTATATNTSILCAGETTSLTITAITGEAPFQYAINNGAYTNNNIFTGLTAGAYTLNVKDANSCLVSLPYTITQPVSLSADVNIQGQTVTINGQGGTAPYQYSQNHTDFLSDNVFTNLGSGEHTLFLKDANGCESSYNVTIADPTPLSSTAAITKPLNCGVKATITVNAAGGIAPYQYSIDGGVTYKTTNVFTTLNAGTYNTVVKDAANTISNTTTIVIDPLIPLVADVAIIKPLDCSSGATIKATVTGGLTPYLYSVDNQPYSPVNTISIYSSGNHTVNILDNAGCIVRKVITIAPYTPITISTAITNVSCNGNNNGLIRVTATNGIAPYTYSIGAGYQTDNIFSNLTPGNYTVSVKDKQGCIVTKPAVITQPTTLASTIDITNATCFNSATGTITVNASGGTVPYSYSVNGTDYFSTKTFNNLSAGIYNVSVKDSKGCTMSFYTTISQPNALVINLTKSDINCNGSQDGEITATANGGNAPYTYSIGTVFNSSNTFSNLAPGLYNVTAKDFFGCTSTSTIIIAQPTALLVSSSVVNPAFNTNDGRITVTATGGTPPYFYALKDSNGTMVNPPQAFNVFTNLTSGSYIAEVTDARGCTSFQTGINIISPPPIVATASVTPITCNTTGIITVTAMGGIAPYQYSFDNGASYTFSNQFNTAIPGNYTIQVRDAQNNTTSVFTVLNPVNPVNIIATIVSPITCSQNGTITATVNGGQAPFVYSLNDGPFQSQNTFNVSAGVYRIVVRDSYGCTAISAVDMTAPDPIVASLTVENQNVTISAIGGSGNYRYAISPDLNLFSTSNIFTNLEAGDYTVKVQDLNGCYVILNFEINPPAPLVEGKDAVTVEFKPGQTLADLVVEGENIKWYSSQNPSESKTSKTNEAPLPLTTVLVDGKTYYASQTINGIESKDRLAVTAKSNGTLSTSDFVLPNFKFYPNPVLHHLTISNTAVIDEVEIYSASGTTILSKKIDSDHSEIDLSNVSSGFYFLKVKSEGKTKIIKIVKK